MSDNTVVFLVVFVGFLVVFGAPLRHYLMPSRTVEVEKLVAVVPANVIRALRSDYKDVFDGRGCLLGVEILVEGHPFWVSEDGREIRGLQMVSTARGTVSKMRVESLDTMINYAATTRRQGQPALVAGGKVNSKGQMLPAFLDNRPAPAGKEWWDNGNGWVLVDL